MAQPANTKLLLHMDGADTSTDFEDKSPSGHTITAQGNAQVDTAQSKFGGGAMLNDGAGDYLSIPDSADWDIGSSEDFFLSLWWKCAAGQNPAYAPWYSNVTSSGGGNIYTGWQLGPDYISAENQPLSFIYYNEGSTAQTVNITGTTDINDQAWHYLEVSRSGSTIRIFVDGTEDASGTFSGAIDAGSGCVIGRQFENADQGYPPGWIEELIYVKGTAGNTGNYTPPTAPWDDLLIPRPRIANVI